MKMREALVCSLAMALLLAALPASAKKPLVDEMAPDFTLRSEGRYNLRLDEQKGYVVVIGFWASWCRSCPPQLKALEALSKKYEEKGVKVWGITLDKSFDDAVHYKDKNDLNFAILHDADVTVSERYDIDDLPAIFVVDRDGKLRLTNEGFNPSDEAKLDQFLQTLVNE